jgi:hypothetical protein
VAHFVESDVEARTRGDRSVFVVVNDGSGRGRGGSSMQVVIFWDFRPERKW